MTPAGGQSVALERQLVCVCNAGHTDFAKMCGWMAK
jgi:hypothetical protein